MRATVRSARVSSCTSGWFWQSVPIRFQMKAIASRRSTSTPRLARPRMMSAYSHEHVGVRPVDVPLVVVERRPDPARELVVPREAAGREVGEHLRQRRARRRRAPSRSAWTWKYARLSASPARAATAHSCSRATWLSTRSRHRLMPSARRVVGELAQVVDGAEVRAHGAVVRHGVAAVVGRRPRRQQRHQVEVAHAQLAQVGRPLADPAQRAGEAVGVGGVAHHRGPLEPVGLTQPQVVERAQVVGARRGAPRGRPRRAARRRRARRPRRRPGRACAGGRASTAGSLLLEGGVGPVHARQYGDNERARHWPGT